MFLLFCQQLQIQHGRQFPASRPKMGALTTQLSQVEWAITFLITQTSHSRFVLFYFWTDLWLNFVPARQVYNVTSCDEMATGKVTFTDLQLTISPTNEKWVGGALQYSCSFFTKQAFVKFTPRLPINGTKKAWTMPVVPRLRSKISRPLQYLLGPDLSCLLI